MLVSNLQSTIAAIMVGFMATSALAVPSGDLFERMELVERWQRCCLRTDCPGGCSNCHFC
ncbi:hypothetical protein JDV02_002972 [Purpureocillium takamizusanense]|uniref:Uncharacterized protein n=1 Tax=Purpureocillium takamizusanense TaxID=2060973 RepID=A0A9Q8QCR6_9HYPO|nr:uncharacterized protein JDV02_002972 [Purpureocillium takamizusanense]UNI16546.1 hypothetical protein JDV02_002972 [Purpureocillium takamizusanense]